MQFVGYLVKLWYDATGVSLGDSAVLAAAAGILNGLVTSVWERLRAAQPPTP